MLTFVLLLLLLPVPPLQAMYDAFQEVFAEELAAADDLAEAVTKQVR
jgi:F0F1-type ATP synthase membrane subunit b/b'